MSADSRSQLERWYDETHASMETTYSTLKDLCKLVKILKAERDAWRTTAFSNEKSYQIAVGKINELLRNQT